MSISCLGSTLANFSEELRHFQSINSATSYALFGKIMLQFSVLCMLLAVMSPVWGQLTKQEEYWHREINESLKANIRRNCKSQHVPGFTVPQDNSDTFYVSTFLPSENELMSLQSLPVSLSKANPDILAVAHYNNFYNDSFLTGIQWQIPDDHPAQNRWLCYNLTKLASKEGILDLYQSFRSVERSFYLLRNRHAMIAPDGSVGFNCGYFQGKEGCETRWNGNQDNWYNKCQDNLRKNNVNWETAWDDSNPTAKATAVEALKNCSTKWETYEYKLNMTTEHLFHPTFHKRVFLIESQWDYNYHHFMADCLARLARNLKFLRANPDIKIHIRSMEEFDTPPIARSNEFKVATRGMRNKLLHLLGIHKERLVWDIVFAEEVFIPRTLHCAFAASNPIEIRLLAKELLRGAHNELPLHARDKWTAMHKNPTRRKNLIIQQRYIPFGTNERFWNNQTTKEVVDEFTLLFPNHNVMVISSLAASQPDYCLDCEIRDYANADILVAPHGAGQTNLMFMPPNSLVVELVAHFNNVNMPVCGYYGPYASMFGLHHYLYGYRYDENYPIRPDVCARETLKFYNQILREKRESLNITKFMYHDKAVVDVDGGHIFY